jgi:cytochrome P450
MLAEVFSSVYTWTLLIIVASAYTFHSRRRARFPVINHHTFDLFNSKAYQDYASNAHNLITRGLAKHNGPFALSIPSGRKIVLPSSFTNWVKSNKDLDHRELVRQDFYAGLPGFEAQTALHSSGDMILDVIRAKLGQNDSVMPILNASVSKALHIHWGQSAAWHTIDWQADTTGIITRAASSIFVGPEKANDKEWLELVQGYVAAYFTAVSELHAYPAWTRPIVQRFLPNANACRKYTARARSIMHQVIAERQAAAEKAKAKGEEIPQFNDALAWTQASSNGKFEAGDIQLSLAMAALFTTSELFRQVLIDVASHPEIIEPLRKEVSDQISKHGMTVAATYNMFLLDSVMKESQRLSAASGSFFSPPPCRTNY